MNCPECGCLLTDVRSLPHHRAFFAYLAFAFKHWPEDGFDDFHPDNPEHLRAWVEVRADFKKPSRHYTFKTRAETAASMTAFEMDKAADRLEGTYSWVVPLKGCNGFEVVRPKSIKWEKLGEARFNLLAGKVSAIIKEIIGVSFSEWKEGAHRAQRDAA
jgi:hypothetical protein